MEDLLLFTQENVRLYIQFSPELYNSGKLPGEGPSRGDTAKWLAHGINVAQLVSPKMLVREAASRSEDRGPYTQFKEQVFLCYNWTFESRFVLMRRLVEETSSTYVPQYGRNENRDQHTKRHHEFIAFSVAEFAAREPALAKCLERA